MWHGGSLPPLVFLARSFDGEVNIGVERGCEETLPRSFAVWDPFLLAAPREGPELEGWVPTIRRPTCEVLPRSELWGSHPRASNSRRDRCSDVPD
jgi:hypothetical protein